MENKYVGWLIVGISFVMAVIVWIFNQTLKNTVDATCSHGSTCTMYETISIQTAVSFVMTVIILIIGLVIMFTKPEERVVVKVVKEKKNKKKLDLTGLEADEKKVVNLLLKEDNAMFQSDLMEKMEMGKVKTTRLLDKLEAKQLIERKRRGMNNIVVLKD